MDRIQESQLQIEQANIKYGPFLSEVRKRVFFTGSIFLIVLIVSFFYSDKIITSIFDIFHIQGVNIVFTSPFQFINLSISVAFLAALTILFPIIILQIISFSKPALNPHEYKAVLMLLPISILLFIMGNAFGLVVMRYMILTFYQQSLRLHIGNFLDISHLLSNILTITIIMGLSFQFPIVMTVLMRLKIVKYKAMVKRRLWVYAIAAIIAGLIPPADFIATVVYFLPIVFLFEFTLLLNKWVLKTHLL